VAQRHPLHGRDDMRGRSWDEPPDDGPWLDEDVMCDCGRSCVMEEYFCCPQCAQEMHAESRAEEQRENQREGRERWT
jgi:hypothetical protein